MINLLPWREQQLARYYQFFFLAIFITILSISGISVFIRAQIKMKLADRQAANQFLQTELKKLPTNIASQKILSESNILKKNTKLITTLYAQNQQAIKLLITIAKYTTASIALESITLNKGCLQLKGRGGNIEIIARLLQNLAASPTLSDAGLLKLKSNRNHITFLIAASIGGATCDT